MALSTTINYDTPGNFTFGSSINLPVSGPATLADQTLTDSTFAATYTSSINGSYGDGTLTGTATGGASVSGAKLDLTGGTTQYVDYDADLNADSQQVGTIRFKLTPNYTGTPSTWQGFFVICEAANDLTNRIEFRQSSSAGQLQFRLDPGGTFTLASWSPTSGQEYEFEFNYDFTGGTSRLFIDGVLHDTISLTQTRSAAIGLLRIGSDYNANETADFSVADFVVFDTVQHTTGYTPGYTVAESRYATDDPTITLNTSIAMDGLDSFTESSSKTGSDEIKYILQLSGTANYWDGANWVTSDGTYAQANTAAEINTNASALDISTGKNFVLIAFLHSDDGSTTPTLTSNTIEYCFFGAAPTALSTCVVWGYIQDSQGNNIQNTEVVVSPATPNAVATNNFQIFSYTGTTTKSALSGYWEITLNRSSEFSPALTYDFKFISPNGDTTIQKGKTVPDQDSQEYNLLN